MSYQKIKSKICDDLGKKIKDFMVEENDFEISKLPGKRNLVFEITFTDKTNKLPKEFVLKIYKNRNSHKEFNMLSELYNKKISVPKILFFEPPLYLLLEKINGSNFADLINKNLQGYSSLEEVNPEDRKDLRERVKFLARWVSEYHRKNLIDAENHSKVIVMNKGDTRLKDFILKNSNEVYGVDFESCYVGNYLDDLAWIACSFLDTDPGIFEMDNPQHKVDLINLFLGEYHRINRQFHFSFNYFAEKLIENLNIVIRRRSLDIGKLNKENVLRKFQELA
ncbi:MAG: hypothetical protein EU550_04050 [Promethearchaeota archaeon]|nr:MAG: hypothetical protein EU550_04050 [Candidatus Lokiarchaeota archaeon]